MILPVLLVARLFDLYTVLEFEPRVAMGLAAAQWVVGGLIKTFIRLRRRPAEDAVEFAINWAGYLAIVADFPAAFSLSYLVSGSLLFSTIASIPGTGQKLGRATCIVSALPSILLPSWLDALLTSLLALIYPKLFLPAISQLLTGCSFTYLMVKCLRTPIIRYVNLLLLVASASITPCTELVALPDIQTSQLVAAYLADSARALLATPEVSELADAVVEKVVKTFIPAEGMLTCLYYSFVYASMPRC